MSYGNEFNEVYLVKILGEVSVSESFFGEVGKMSRPTLYDEVKGELFAIPGEKDAYMELVRNVGACDDYEQVIETIQNYIAYGAKIRSLFIGLYNMPGGRFYWVNMKRIKQALAVWISTDGLKSALENLKWVQYEGIEVDEDTKNFMDDFCVPTRGWKLWQQPRWRMPMGVRHPSYQPLPF